MNKYEQYQQAHMPVVTTKWRHKSRGTPLYTIEEAIALAGELPGLNGTVENRIEWIRSMVMHDMCFIESNEEGLVLVHRSKAEEI